MVYPGKFKGIIEFSLSFQRVKINLYLLKFTEVKGQYAKMKRLSTFEIVN